MYASLTLLVTNRRGHARTHTLFPPAFPSSTQLVAHAQWAGAVGFVFVNYYDDLFTYIPYQLPFNVTLPFVNVMYTYGTMLIDRIR